MCEERVTEALNALRSADAGVETGPESEIRTLLAFRRQQRRRRLRRMAAVWGASGAIAAAAIVLLVLQDASAKLPEAWPSPTLHTSRRPRPRRLPRRLRSRSTRRRL